MNLRVQLPKISLGRIRVRTRKDGKQIMESQRRDMSRFDKQPAGVKQFTQHANSRAKAANRAKNKRARKARRVTRSRS